MPPVLAVPAEEFVPTMCCKMPCGILSIVAGQMKTYFLPLPLYIGENTVTSQLDSGASHNCVSIVLLTELKAFSSTIEA